MSQPSVKQIWLRSLLLRGPVWGVLWSGAMAIVDHRPYLEVFWTVGALGGLASGAALGFWATQLVNQVCFVSPGPPPPIDSVIAAASRIGFELRDNNEGVLSFLQRRPLLDHRAPLVVEIQPEQLTVTGPRFHVPALLRRLSRPHERQRTASSPSSPVA